MKTWSPNLKVAVVLIVCLAVSLPAAAQTARIYSFNGRIPLGIESFRLQPTATDFYLMASAENPLFADLYRETDHRGHGHLLSAGGPVQFYPARVQFRLTASAREKIIQERPFDMQAKLSLNDLLAQLHFRLKVFHALEYRYVKPKFVEEVGLPKDIPYDERIYRIGFELEKVPIEDRVVMEVISPSGERLCKFHLDLF